VKLAIFGATGKTGLEVIKQALNRGHEVTVMVRDPKRLPNFSKPINVLTGDFSNLDTEKSTLIGQDAVICALGSRELYKNTGLRTLGTRAIIRCMEEEGVRRLVVMSSMGIGESWNQLSFFSKALFKLVMPAALEDHEAQEEAVKASALEWTLIRPSGLTNEPNVSAYEYGKELVPKTSRISRANVADLMLKVLENQVHIHESITISN
jgi:putative NADH-flavin reductase